MLIEQRLRLYIGGVAELSGASPSAEHYRGQIERISYSENDDLVTIHFKWAEFKSGKSWAPAKNLARSFSLKAYDETKKDHNRPDDGRMEFVAAHTGGKITFTLPTETTSDQPANPLTRTYLELFDAGCIKFGEFKLKSGIMSPVYVDFRGLVSDPVLLDRIGFDLGERALEIGCDRLAGIPYAGIPLAIMTSHATAIPMIYTRKEVKDYGTKKIIEGAYVEGEQALVIDDIITDGASKIEAIKPLEEVGLIVKDVLIVLDREQGGAAILAKAGYTLHCLGKLSEVLDVLVQAGKVTPEKQAEVAKFIAANQFEA